MSRQLWRPAPQLGLAALRRPEVYAFWLSRRTYLDSVDRTVTVKSMEDPLEVLKFMAEHSDSDTRTLEAALRTLGRLAVGDTCREVLRDGRFHAVLSALAGRLDDCDARLLSMIADGAARFRTSSPELADLAQRIAEAIVRRPGDLDPKNLASVAMALAIREVRDMNMVEFVKNEAIRMMDDLEPYHCVMLLEAFRRWRVFDRQLVDLIVERMCDEVDHFSTRDIVDTLMVVSRIGLPRGFLLRRLCNLVFENLRQFTPRELAKITCALAKLRFLTQSSVDEMVDALVPDIERLVGSQVSELLFALAMTNSRHQLDFARKLVAHYVGSKGGVSEKTLGSLVDFCWSLVALEIVDEFTPEFKAAIETILSRDPPQNRVPLVKLFDVLISLEQEHKGLGISVNQEWLAACDDADRYEMDRLEGSRLHNEIVMRFDHLRGNHNGLRWQLRMQRIKKCGPYRVDMLDEDTKIALDMEIVSWPTSRLVKHRILNKLGFRPVALEYWEWRRARTEQDQNMFLEREVTKVLDAKPLGPR